MSRGTEPVNEDSILVDALIAKFNEAGIVEGGKPLRITRANVLANLGDLIAAQTELAQCLARGRRKRANAVAAIVSVITSLTDD